MVVKIEGERARKLRKKRDMRASVGRGKLREREKKERGKKEKKVRIR